MCMQMSMQTPNPECLALQTQISSLQIVKNIAQTTTDIARNVINCATVDSGNIDGYLGSYVAASNSLSKIQANIESVQSRHEELCA